MQMSLPKYDVVLLGIGHTNAHVLRTWRMKPIPDARLTCVSNYPVTTYSGMLPGVLAGQYPPERMEIDLVRLCAAAGARLIEANVTGLDVAECRLLLEGRPPLPFDVLSVGIGSVPSRDSVDIQDESLLLAIKPMQTILGRLEARLRAWHAAHAGRPLRVVVVGGGAGGVEITFCLPARVRAVLGEVPLEMTLVNGHEQVVPGVRPKTAALVRGELEARGVRLRLGRRAIRLAGGAVTLDDGEALPADLVIWATSAAAPPLLARLGLPTDAAGFLLTRPTLQTLADAPVFAVGDSGTVKDSPTPKAGVYAVRQGPVLWENIGRLLAGRPLEPYVPQKGFLKLLNTGDGRAIGEYGRFSFRGRWAWRLKNYIDGRFMDMYQDYRPMAMEAPGATAPVMRCAGCGGKVSGSVLSHVLARLEVPPSEHVLLGLDRPDDAAIVRPPGGRPVTVTVDFFAAPLDDPYLVGRIAALNSASDVFAMGARPLAALAMATVPVGPARQQEQLLYEVLAGSIEEFKRMGATLVGGHTIEGPQLTVGYTMLADQGDRPPRTKALLRPGDRLILTKALGSGILLAAHMRAQCRAEWLGPLLRTMLASNQAAAQRAEDFDLGGLTDVTGFGLAGHLLEMLHASGAAAELRLADVPLLPGVADLIAAGVESTLAPANRLAEAEVAATAVQRESPAYAALFDPQTSGGLLLGVPAPQAAPLLESLLALGQGPAWEIGSIVAPRPDQPIIRIV